MPRLTRRSFLRVSSAAALLGAAGVRLRAAQPTSRERFTFLHSYESTGRYWHGLEKAGLLRPGNGVRLVNSPWGEDSRRFNQTARRGGPLHAILQERRCPFIVDRVVGGSQYYPYAFDQGLIAEYQAMLGEKFLGGQVHETISNLRTDWNRVAQARKKLAKEPITAADLLGYFTGEDPPHWLDYNTADAYADRLPPSSEAAWWQEFERAAKVQGARFGGRFSYCEGSHHGQLAWAAFYRFGAAYGLAEVGPWASQQTQFAIMALRGAARAARRPWGVFFAPWGPQGCTCFIPLNENSWQISAKMFATSGLPFGPQYGCSSAMQRRIFFHAYLAGAHTLHEEWGAEGNLVDWDAGTLSSYGRATGEFLDFVEANPDVGEPYTPIALVADAALPPDEAAWKPLCSQLFQPSEAEKALAARKDANRGEADCYPPCALPELFDVVPSDAPADLWPTYQEVIPVATAPAPAGTTACPANEVFARLTAAVARLSPFTRRTHLSMQINRRASDGAWIVGLYNPWGATRGDVEGTGSLLAEECTIRETLDATFAVRSVRTLYAWPVSSQAAHHDRTIEATVGPGGTLILEIQPA